MKIAVIIPTWNNVPYLYRCLESLYCFTTEPNWRVIVIDNGSTDDTPEYLESKRAWVESNRVPHSLHIISNTENLGFIRATNQGLLQLEEKEHALLLNDDTQIVDPSWLTRLAANLQNNVGAVGPVSNFVMGLQSMSYSDRLPLGHFTNLLIGFCLLLHADAVARVGLLDERFGLGGNDDLDYSIRLQEAGFALRIERAAFVFHYGAKSISRIGGYQIVEPATRQILVDKWGQERIDKLFWLTPDIADAFTQAHPAG